MEKPQNQNNPAGGLSDLTAVLAHVASIAHCGGLLGFPEAHAAMREIARLTLTFWDKDECNRLQDKG